MSDNIPSSLTPHFTPALGEEEIAEITRTLARKIRSDYEGEPLLLVGVLKGAAVFLSDLIRALGMDVEIDFVRLSSYGKGRESSGTVTLLKDISRDIRGKHVIIVEEIIDSGRSLRFLYDRLKQSEPASLEIVTLLDKHQKRVVDVPVKYVGKKVDDAFLIGYGLDLEERARNYSSILALTYPN
ncbi:hypoxanthine phosphoribosyltransferase [bacterium]|jgi:hypoxanthine phosphoribosyltransferase|nr:hypoxanthine phosphoribosyltransferase [bacterium]